MRSPLQEATHWNQSRQGKIQLIAAQSAPFNPIGCIAARESR